MREIIRAELAVKSNTLSKIKRGFFSKALGFKSEVRTIDESHLELYFKMPFESKLKAQAIEIFKKEFKETYGDQVLISEKI